MMDWLQLLSAHRAEHVEASDKVASRSAFQKDWDRVVFSSAFRRLQDKTQVHSLPASDYVRTRLTHSLEVASVGRSLGARIGETVIARHKGLERSATPADFGYIVAAACLAHDIGNPPFGHYGEETIRHWFRKPAGGSGAIAALTPAEQKDFLEFEGNAQGFRVVTQLQNWRRAGGLRLTAATLGTFTKYPRSAGAEIIASRQEAGAKKFGFFQSEAPLFRALAVTLGLTATGPDSWLRHPLAFLVEAADDICYHIIDLEDGCKIGRVRFEDAEAFLLAVIGDRPSRYSEIDEPSEKLGYLRAKAMGHLIYQVANLFLDDEPGFLRGDVRASLIDRIDEAKILGDIFENTRQVIFTMPERVKTEISAGQIIAALLQEFVGAELADEAAALGGASSSPREQALLKLLPARDQTSRYRRLQGVTDYISGMTDSYAIEQFRLIQGLQRD